MERVSVRVVGCGAAGVLLGGLLGRAGHPLVFVGPPGEASDLARDGLRLVLPSGWAAVRPAGAASAASGLAIVAEPLHRLRQAARRRKGGVREALGIGPAELPVLVNGEPDDLAALGGGAAPGAAPVLLLALLEAWRPQPSDVELYSERPALLWGKRTLPDGLFTPLKAFGFELSETEDIGAAAHAHFLWRLPDLPAALCGTTRGHFLSFREGREIARRVLEEGITVFTRMHRKPARLPRHDPMELLKRLQRGDRELEDGRCRPDRAFGPLLRMVPPGVPAVDADEAREVNGRLVRLGSDLGVDARWNSRLVQKLERVLRQGPFPDPARLLEAVE